MATFETLVWCALIGLVWLAAIRAPNLDEDARRQDDEEDRRLWYAADLRNRIDRGL